MSQELKAVAQRMIAAASDEFLKILITMPADKFAWKPEPTTRSAQEIAWHVAVGLKFMGPSLRGEKPKRSDVTWFKRFQEEHQTRESLKALIGQVLKEIHAAIDHLKDFEQPCQMYWGETWSASKVLFRGCFEHTAYHGGQLAYIQTLLGDTQDHF